MVRERDAVYEELEDQAYIPRQSYLATAAVLAGHMKGPMHTGQSRMITTERPLMRGRLDDV